MYYLLPNLPYPYNGLEPFINAQTVKLHHDAHHLGYIKKLNVALESVQYPKIPLPDLLRNLREVPTSIRQTVRDNAGGFYNHNLYWEELVTAEQNIPEKLGKALKERFGDFESFKNKLIECSMSWVGSGWAWLYLDTQKNLQIGVTINHDNPLMEYCPLQGTPLLTLDLWEHAYYLQYKNDKKAYFDAFFQHIAWTYVEQLYLQAKQE
ncbi:MAG: superoxide dismutase [Puniceicoccales bacterium]|jgi:Fe-Mn family superoxide dismutase|nr:superoxide dismutase [Puniceicoccales bacterium]